MATALFNSLFRRAPQVPIHPPRFPFTLETNPYHCKKPWPPDFAQLSPKHQFRLERRYRRRTKLKWARPGWTKATTLAQWGSIVFVVIYGVLFLEVQDGKEVRGTDGHKEKRGVTVFDGIREWYWGQMDEWREMRRPQAGCGPGVAEGQQRKPVG